jgi:hypothetical protein
MNVAIANPAIVATIVPDAQRMAFLPRKLPRFYRRIEPLVFRFMGLLDATYEGGYWEFVDLSNGGFYLRLLRTGLAELSWDGNGFSGSLSQDAAGIVASLFALNHLCNSTEQPAHVDLYFHLRDFAGDHPEAGLIFDAID